MIYYHGGRMKTWLANLFARAACALGTTRDIPADIPWGGIPLRLDVRTVRKDGSVHVTQPVWMYPIDTLEINDERPRLVARVERTPDVTVPAFARYPAHPCVCWTMTVFAEN